MLSVIVGLAWPPACLPLNIAAGALIAFLLSVARVCAHLPFAVYKWQGVSLGFLVVAASLVFVLGLLALAGRLGVGVLRYAMAPRRRQMVALAAAVVLALAMVLAPAAPAAPSVPTLRPWPPMNS